MRRQLALALLLLAAAQPAEASEYCVVCYTPDARYRCMTSDGREGQGTDQRAWLQCITQLARSGNHESCSIDKASTAPCLGVVKQIDLATIDEMPRPTEPAGPQQPRTQARRNLPTANRRRCHRPTTRSPAASPQRLARQTSPDLWKSPSRTLRTPAAPSATRPKNPGSACRRCSRNADSSPAPSGLEFPQSVQQFPATGTTWQQLAATPPFNDPQKPLVPRQPLARQFLGP